MKRVKDIIIVLIILISMANVSFAHGGNIKGWKDKNSKYVTEYNGKYYGYHKQDEKVHYHRVKWNEEKQKWEIIAPAVYYDENFNKIQNNDEVGTSRVEVKLIATVDGDTARFKVNGEEIIVRFLGIDTRETNHPQKGEEPYGKEASNFTKEKLENATKIELEFDASADKKDKYDRYLAWVWVDDKLLQNLLVENGLAKIFMLQNNYRYAGMLQESEEDAKNNKLGIWSKEVIKEHNNENQIVKDMQGDVKIDNPISMVICFIIMLFASVFSIAYKKRKRK